MSTSHPGPLKPSVSCVKRISTRRSASRRRSRRPIRRDAPSRARPLPYPSGSWTATPTSPTGCRLAGDLAPRPPLDGTTECDVAILGAGYTGLWTAYYLLERQPGLRIVIAEAEIAGFGASGRNGAWCAPDLNISMDRLARLHGEDAARRTQQATYDAVDEVGRAAAAEGLDAGFHKGGELLVARGPQHVPAIEAAYREYERFGFADRYRLLDAAGVAEKVRIAGAVRGLWSPTAAVVHPGRLVRGLAALVERMGARIVERTPVSDFRAAVSGPRRRRAGSPDHAPGRDPGPRDRARG